MSEFSIESLIAESTGLVEKPVVKTYNVSRESQYDGDSDSLIKDWYKSVEDFNSYCTLDAIRDLHASEKIRMLNNIKRVYGNSIEHYGAKLSIESHIDRTIMSIEEDKTNGNKKENPIITFFKFIGKMVSKAFTIIKEKLSAFWGWLKKKINNLKEKRSQNLTQDIQRIEKEIDAVIAEAANENAGDSGEVKKDPIEEMGKHNTTALDPDKIKKRIETIGQIIDKCIGKLNGQKEKGLIESENEAKETMSKLQESKKLVEQLIQNGPAFLKKPNAFKSKLDSIKKTINDAKAKSANIKYKKAKIAEVIKSLGLDAVPDIRDNRSGSWKIDGYLNDVSGMLDFCNKNIGKIFGEGATKIHYPKNGIVENEDNNVFTDFQKFVTQILGWKMVSIRDAQKSTNLLEQIYTKDNIKKLGEFAEHTIKRLNESCSKLQELIKRAEGIKADYFHSTAPINGGDGSTPENKNTVSEGNTLGFVKFKGILKGNVNIINAMISNMTKLTQISSKIITSLFDTGNGTQSNNSDSKQNAA